MLYFAYGGDNLSTKTIQFDKFRPYFLEVDAQGVRTENILDLSSLLREIAGPEFHPAVQVILGDIYRFHKCSYDAALGIWELQILHLREKILPGMAGRESGYDIISLPDGKYAAESSTLLYDPTDSVLYMQRNVFCMSPKKLEMYLSLILPQNTRVALKVIQARNQIQSITAQKRYRKIVLVANAKETRGLEAGSSLLRLLNTHAQYGGHVAHIEISMGRKKGILNSEATAELIQEAYEAASTQQLKVCMADPDDVDFSTVDLLEDRDSYKVTLEYSRDNPITHQRLWEGCKECYQREHNR